MSEAHIYSMRDIIHHNDYAIIIVDLNDTEGNMFIEKATSFYGTLFLFFALNFSPYFGVMSSNGSSLVLISVRLFPPCLSRYVFFYTFSDCILFCDNYRYN